MIATVEKIMEQTCPTCGALPQQNCVNLDIRSEEVELPDRWHIARRHEAELLITERDPEVAADLLPPLQFFYCSTLLTKTEQKPNMLTSSTSSTLHRVLARSYEEARGLAFHEAIKAKPDFSVMSIRTMQHLDDGVTLAETPKPGPQ